jgi:HEAT repeat protein
MIAWRIRISSAVLAAILAAGVLASGNRGLAQSAPTTKGLSEAEALELKTLTGQLADTQRQPKTRIEAAELLLSRDYPQAADAIKGFLSDTSNRGAQVAVAEAISRRGEGIKEFVEPLVAMLAVDDASARSASARALAAYRDDDVTDRLIQIIRDARRPAAIRQEVIASLQRTLEQKVAGALVGLLEDSNPAIVASAADALGRLANLRGFGADAERWRAWWRQNRDKPRAEWLAELAASLARSQADLESENLRLRDRLGKAVEDVYAATPSNQRDIVLMGYLKDPLADVRVAACRLVDRRLAAAEAMSPDLRAQVKAMLADADPRVRQKAAILFAALGEADASKIFLERLAGEESPDVRKAVLAAIGQAGEPACVPALLSEIKSPRADLAAAAARAVGRIAARQKLDESSLDDTVIALRQRYEAVRKYPGGDDLPEALLAAMGAVGSEEFLPLLVEATKAPLATVRLSAIGGMKAFARPDVIAVISGLVSDSDRGVRQAALAALGAMGGPRNFQTIVARTDPDVESDAAVRQQAWDAAMAALAKADAETLQSAVAGLAGRADAAAPRIKIRQMLVASLRSAKSDDFTDALRQLGADLLKAGRPSEAAPALGEAWAAMAAARNAKAMDVWHEWVEALVSADDPGIAKALADQADREACARGLERLLERIDTLAEKGKWQAVAQLAAVAGNHLSGRLTEAQAKSVAARAAEAKAKLAEVDRQKVPALVVQLTAGEESARKSAAAELQAMGERCVAPLLEELKKVLSADAENRAAESAIMDVLKQAAPKLAGYDSAASKADRLKIVEGWMKK